MNFAVAQISGKQYLLNENQTLLVDKLNYSEGESFVIDQVLLVNADDEVKIGTPFVENAKIQVKVIAQEKGPKIRVAKFKAKSRYRRVMGFRSRLTKIQIISLSGEKPVKESLPAGPLRRIEASRQEKTEKPKIIAKVKVVKPATKKTKTVVLKSPSGKK